MTSRWCFFLAALLVTLTGCGDARSVAPVAVATNAPAPVAPVAQGHLPHAQPQLPTIRTWVGQHELKTELAVKSVEIQTGMMWRTNLADTEAMLFVFAGPAQRAFYMRNCTVALSAAYIDAAGVIQEIVDLHPGVEEPVYSKSANIKYVLEVPQGWFKRHGISEGAAINTERGPLRNLRGELP